MCKVINNEKIEIMKALTKKQVEDLNSKMKYDLQLAFISNTKKVKCYLGSFMTKETEDLLFAMNIINQKIEGGSNYSSLLQLPFFK
jgi:hypothetical protein